MARLAAPARVESLILSDVIGDDLSSIASGPTAPDPTTFQNAREILVRYELLKSVPGSVRARIERGQAGDVPETLDASDPVFARVENRLVGSNSLSLRAARRQAEQWGIRALVGSDELVGEARQAAGEMYGVARDRWDGRNPLIILFGGETTVTVRGDGVGGRNQELALAFAMICREQPPAPSWVLLSGGTDGRDGPTEAAGAVVDEGTLDRLQGAGLDARKELNRNNSHAALAATGDLLMTGPTGTNVADLQVLILLPDPRSSRTGSEP